MKPIVKFIVLAVPAASCFIFYSSFPLTQQRSSIAVIQLDCYGLTHGQAATLTERLRSELTSTGRFRVLEREKMEEILREQGFQQAGCVSNECMVKVGRLVAVEKIVGGSVGKVGNTYTINVRMISVESGEIVRVATEDLTGEVDLLLTRGMMRIAQKLAGAITQDLEVLPLDNPAGIEFVLIKGGSFEMGDTFGEGGER